MSTEPSKVFERRFQNRLADLNRATEEAVRFIEEIDVDYAASDSTAALITAAS